MRKIEDLINLSDIILDKLENIHIDAKGTIKDKSESANIGIDISNLNDAKIEITCWDEWNSITGKIEHKKKATISFTDYEMDYKFHIHDERTSYFDSILKLNIGYITDYYDDAVALVV